MFDLLRFYKSSLKNFSVDKIDFLYLWSKYGPTKID